MDHVHIPKLRSSEPPESAEFSLVARSLLIELARADPTLLRRMRERKFQFPGFCEIEGIQGEGG